MFETSYPVKICEKWKHDFELLFAGVSDNGEFDDKFLRQRDML